eukprot:766783-Hanusia_phi.AAC.5
MAAVRSLRGDEQEPGKRPSAWQELECRIRMTPSFCDWLPPLCLRVQRHLIAYKNHLRSQCASLDRGFP